MINYLGEKNSWREKNFFYKTAEIPNPLTKILKV